MTCRQEPSRHLGPPHFSTILHVGAKGLSVLPKPSSHLYTQSLQSWSALGKGYTEVKDQFCQGPAFLKSSNSLLMFRDKPVDAGTQGGKGLGEPSQDPEVGDM